MQMGIPAVVIAGKIEHPHAVPDATELRFPALATTKVAAVAVDAIVGVSQIAKCPFEILGPLQRQGNERKFALFITLNLF
ncbi:hypothetical protein [Maioricimonas sp. JC845]|uniref:hypothetical protein n=1 Tax=Maioricimonas sp. JC845 TaxID=3232138 RepID=UPI00345AF442